MHACANAYARTYARVHMHVYVHASTEVYTHACVMLCMCAGVRICMCTYSPSPPSYIPGDHHCSDRDGVGSVMPPLCVCVK